MLAGYGRLRASSKVIAVLEVVSVSEFVMFHLRLLQGGRSAPEALIISSYCPLIERPERPETVVFDQFNVGPWQGRLCSRARAFRKANHHLYFALPPGSAGPSVKEVHK
jgi:hypothetical protein